MNANEFRIGNFLLIIGLEPVQITANHILSISKGDTYYKPTPLTEEWLLKFGFNHFTNGFYEISNFPGSIHKSKAGYFFEMEVYGGDYFTIEVKHVHQLQNLYFALTQHELTISKNIPA